MRSLVLLAVLPLVIAPASAQTGATVQRQVVSADRADAVCQLRAEKAAAAEPTTPLVERLRRLAARETVLSECRREHRAVTRY